MIEVNDLSVSYGTQRVLQSLSFHVNKGRFLGVVGANGSGKTTLLHALSGLHKQSRDTISLNGRDLKDYSSKELARTVAVLAQESLGAFDTSVYEAVELGRYAHKNGLLQRLNERDRTSIRKAMQETGVAELASFGLMTLSGGERQRVWLARALTQEPKILLLDEPTNHLDLAHQVQLLDYLRALVTKNELTVVAILHDVNMAALYCDEILGLKDGEIEAIGTPHEVLTTERMECLYQTSFIPFFHPEKGTRLFSIRPKEERWIHSQKAKIGVEESNQGFHLELGAGWRLATNQLTDDVFQKATHIVFDESPMLEWHNVLNTRILVAKTRTRWACCVQTHLAEGALLHLLLRLDPLVDSGIELIVASLPGGERVFKRQEDVEHLMEWCQRLLEKP
ncbi:ABC transporter ATP-binding protein [Shouchella shacheensis]|uniref:ABC transporter ATP-binding protein n=1 Tax=Shouchella shacheensis TaxID=1649580 RepID=UPI00073FB2DF|nr:ABC transporter ATP-binding protein [Shouchella shacheensis]